MESDTNAAAKIINDTVALIKTNETLEKKEKKEKKAALGDWKEVAKSLKESEDARVAEEAERDRIAQAERDRVAQAERDRVAQEERDRIAQAERDRIAQEEGNKIAKIVPTLTKEELIRKNTLTAGFSSKEINDVEKLLTKEGDAETIVNDLMKIPSDDKRMEALKKHIEVNNVALVASKQATDQNKFVLRNRMASTGINNMGDVNNNPIPVASGDNDCLENYNSGIWFMPIYSQATQRKDKQDIGYKVKSAGGIIGADTKLNDGQTMIGAAFSAINSAIKYKTQYKDKTKANNLIFSLYGKQNIMDRLFVQALASYATAKVRHKEERIFSTGSEFARAKYTSRSYGGEVLFGYDAKLCKEAILTPFAGISYIKFKDGGYKETGLSFAGRTVEPNKSDRTDGIIGIRLSTVVNTDSGMRITPEIHGVYTRKLKGKAGKIVAKIDGTNEPFTDVPKLIKSVGNIGVSVTAKSGMFEYGAGYDLQLAKKYIGTSRNFETSYLFVAIILYKLFLADLNINYRNCFLASIFILSF